MNKKDEKELREELRDYYGTAVVNGFPMVMMELNEVDDMSEEELREKAEKIGLD